MNLLIAIVLYAIVLCRFGVPQTSTTIGSVSECVVPASSDADRVHRRRRPGARRRGRPQAGRPVRQHRRRARSTTLDEVGRDHPRAPPGETLEVVIERDGERADASSSRPILNRARGARQPRAGRSPTSAATRSRRRSASSASATCPSTRRSRSPRCCPRSATTSSRVGKIIITLPKRLVQVGAGGLRRRGPRPERPDQRRRHRPHRRRDRQLRPADGRRPRRVAHPASSRASTSRCSSSTSCRCCRSTAGTSRARCGRGCGAGWRSCSSGPIRARSTPRSWCRSPSWSPVLLGAMSLLLIYADIVNPISCSRHVLLARFSQALRARRLEHACQL